jgi:hypothetical protein
VVLAVAALKQAAVVREHLAKVMRVEAVLAL